MVAADSRCELRRLRKEVGYEMSDLRLAMEDRRRSQQREAAWIEITGRAAAKPRSYVALRKEAWIEISIQRRLFCVSMRRSPQRRAWTEMAKGGCDGTQYTVALRKGERG